MQTEVINRERWGELEEVEEGKACVSALSICFYVISCAECVFYFNLQKKRTKRKKKKRTRMATLKETWSCTLEWTRRASRPHLWTASPASPRDFRPPVALSTCARAFGTHSLPISMMYWAKIGTNNDNISLVIVETRPRTSHSSSTRSWSRKRRQSEPRSMAPATSMWSQVRQPPLSLLLTGRVRKLVACAVALKMQVTRQLHRRTTMTRLRRRRKKPRPRRTRSTRISSFKVAMLAKEQISTISTPTTETHPCVCIRHRLTGFLIARLAVDGTIVAPS